MIFNKQKKSKQLSLVYIVNALQKEKIGDNDALEEIKLDLQENIPLSQKKVECLKEGICKLKEIKSQTKSKTDLPKDVESKKNIKSKKEKLLKKPRFGNIWGRKNKKIKNTEPQLSRQENSDVNKHPNENNLLRDEVKLSPPEQIITHDSKINHKINDEQKRTGFSKFLNIKKKSQKVAKKPTQNEVLDLPSPESDKIIEKVVDIKDTTSFTDPNKTETKIMSQIDHKLPDSHQAQELEFNVEQSHNVNTNPLNEESTYRFEKSHSHIKHVLDDLNKEKELLKTDIEEAKQLDDIKQLLTELSKEKEQLKTNVDEIKLRFNVKPLVKKYDGIEQRLQSATDILYSIQSDIYERIREIRILRKDLSAIKEDLSSL